MPPQDGVEKKPYGEKGSVRQKGKKGRKKNPEGRGTAKGKTYEQQEFKKTRELLH